MIVVIAGMFRSGSTFSFNIVRELLAGAVEVSLTNSIPDERSIRDHSKSLVILSHAPDDALMNLVRTGRAACICTFRRPEDVIASWIDTFEFCFKESVEMMRTWLDWRNSARGPMLNLRYEDIRARPQRAMLMIQRCLFGRVDRKQARQLSARYNHARAKRAREAKPDNIDAINIGLTAYESAMLSQPQFVSSFSRRGFANNLSEMQVAAVREALSIYVDANGEYHPMRLQLAEFPSKAVDVFSIRAHAKNAINDSHHSFPHV